MPDDPPATQASIDNEFDANCESRFTRRQKDDRARDLGRLAEALAQEWTVEKRTRRDQPPIPEKPVFRQVRSGTQRTICATHLPLAWTYYAQAVEVGGCLLRSDRPLVQCLRPDSGSSRRENRRPARKAVTVRSCPGSRRAGARPSTHRARRTALPPTP